MLVCTTELEFRTVSVISLYIRKVTLWCFAADVGIEKDNSAGRVIRYFPGYHVKSISYLVVDCNKKTHSVCQ